MANNRASFLIRAILALAVCCSFGFTNKKADDPIDKLVAALQKWNAANPIEKVYLHTDKAYYNIGDTLWFKAYLTDAANRASKHSALLYVELNDDSAETVRRISIPIKQGQAIGQIPLPRKIFRQGGYTLRAYTNWMQNFGDAYFFNQRFYLGEPSPVTWLVRSAAAIEPVGEKSRLDVDVKLYLGDRKPVSLSNVEVKIYEGRYYLFKEEMRTGIDGSLNFSKLLKDKVDGRDLNIQITSLEKAYPNKVIRIPLIINRDAKIDLQFLPEGGKLVAGIPSVVGFKAIGEDGKGIDIKATILDSKGTKVADISSLHHGMGSFKLTPQAGQTYVAKLVGGRSNNKTYSLPVAGASGLVMHIDNPEQGDQLKIDLRSTDQISPDSAYHLEGIANGKTCYSEKIDANKSIAIDKVTFPSGITRFTLFKGITPVAERAIFIDHKDRLDIRIVTNKDSYQKRDSVGIDITIKDAAGIPVQGSFSLSVTDNTQVKPDTLNNFGIATSLLLNAGLKGYIEDPGYYLTRKDPQAWQALDNLMLTQGWTGYDWADIFGPPKTAQYKVEKDLEITGRVVNLANRPVPNTSVIISSQKPSFLAMSITDSTGRYAFTKLPPIDSGSFFIQANDKNGKARSFGQISVDKFIPALVPEMYRTPIMPWFVNSDTTQLNRVKRVNQQADFSNIKGEGTMLKNVNIKTAKVIKNSLNPYGPGMSDLSFDEKDIKEAAVMNLWQLLKQKMPGLVCYGYRFDALQDELITIPTFKWGNFYISGAPPGASIPPGIDMNIDGWPIQLNEGESGAQVLSDIPAAQIKGVEIIYSTKYTNRSVQIGRGMSKPGYRDYYYAKVEITTNNGVGWFKKNIPGRVTYRPLPVMFPKQFYSPRYVANAAVIQPDYRSTIHWEPQLYTDYNGKARISFYTSDLPKDYTINIQGMSPEGEIGGLVQKMGNKPVSAANTKP